MIMKTLTQVLLHPVSAAHIISKTTKSTRLEVHHTMQILFPFNKIFFSLVWSPE
jgi:hypothetical protein